MSREPRRGRHGAGPVGGGKVATLDPAGDIDDPIGGDLSLYQDLAGQLQSLIEQRLKERDILAGRRDRQALPASPA